MTSIHQYQPVLAWYRLAWYFDILLPGIEFPLARILFIYPLSPFLLVLHLLPTLCMFCTPWITLTALGIKSLIPLSLPFTLHPTTNQIFPASLSSTTHRNKKKRTTLMLSS